LRRLEREPFLVEHLGVGRREMRTPGADAGDDGQDAGAYLAEHVLPTRATSAAGKRSITDPTVERQRPAAFARKDPRGRAAS
jgi:hypothetical protein